VGLAGPRLYELLRAIYRLHPDDFRKTASVHPAARSAISCASRSGSSRSASA
jgi:hypothetical protein